MVGWNRPSLGIVSQGYLGQFLLNLILFTFIIIWQYISESEAVIEDTEDDLHRAACLLFIVDCQFVVVITYGIVLAPKLLPGLVFRRTSGEVTNSWALQGVTSTPTIVLTITNKLTMILFIVIGLEFTPMFGFRLQM